MQGFLRTTMELTFTRCTKYYIVKWHYFSNAVQNGEVAVLKVDTLHQGVDYLRKGLACEAFEQICKINKGWQTTNKLSGLILDLLLSIVWLLLFVIF
jgi:hypothetical protein